jgi:hypothetical protein
LAIIVRNVPYVRALHTDERKHLEELIQIFIAEKNFEGCGGLAVDDAMKTIVAAEACVLLLGREKPSFFPSLNSVLLYPGAFYAADGMAVGEHQWIAEDSAEKLGESWHRGAIILSWEHVKREGNMLNDGLNVVLHEFAHQLDEERGFADGTPDLASQGLKYSEWSEVMSHEYSSFLRDLRRGRRNPIDEYAAKCPAEFFAVATETFFERPLQLRSRHPKLYDEFVLFYGVDPAAWREAANALQL